MYIEYLKTLSITFQGLNSELLKLIFKRAAIQLELSKLNINSMENIKFIEAEKESMKNMEYVFYQII